jgi:hypothetical protein
MTTNITAESSHGTLTFDTNGQVVAYERYDETDPESQFLADITRVDVKELAQYLNDDVSALRGQWFDILDIGYWYPTDDGEKYEPATDHRKVSFEEMNPEEAGLL